MRCEVCGKIFGHQSRNTPIEHKYETCSENCMLHCDRYKNDVINSNHFISGLTHGQIVLLNSISEWEILHEISTYNESGKSGKIYK